MKMEDEIFILDSKYYRYGSVKENHVKYLPGSESIVKQIVYSSYLEEKYPDNQIHNVFLIPYAKAKEDCIIKYAGCVKAGVNSTRTSDKIHVVLIDLRYAIETWNVIKHSTDRVELSELILDNEDRIIQG